MELQDYRSADTGRSPNTSEFSSPCGGHGGFEVEVGPVFFDARGSVVDGMEAARRWFGFGLRYGGLGGDGE